MATTFTPGIENILQQNNDFGWDQSDYKTGIMDQYTDIASQYNQPVTYADSPVFQAGFEKWNPSSLSSVFAAATQKAKSGLGLQTAAAAAPFGGGLYVPPIENVIQDYPKSLKTQKELGEWDWATQFGHEASHLGWEYENPLKQIQSISPHLKAEATNPSYAGEEQWNYMHDLMYGPRYDEELLGRPGEKYLTTKELINPGDLSYTPKAFDIISKSGLIPEHKKAIGFGVNPFEDTQAAGQWYKMQQEKKAAQKHNILQRKIKAAQQATVQQAAAAHAARQRSTPGYGSAPGGQGFDAGTGRTTTSGYSGKTGQKEMMADGGLAGLVYLLYGGRV